MTTWSWQQTIYVNHDNFLEIESLDKSFIGTNKYMGFAYFWAYEWRHYLRNATPYMRKRVHDLFRRADLNVDGETPEHAQIVHKVCGA